MKNSEILALEAANTSLIVLLKEGIFFRAYEHSAYFFFHTIEPYALVKRAPKNLKGETIVCLGFPAKEVDRVLAGHKRLVDEKSRIEIESRMDFDMFAFNRWKNSLELYASPKKKEAAVTMSPQQNSPEKAVAEAVKSYDLVNSTPFECMKFVAGLKALL